MAKDMGTALGNWNQMSTMTQNCSKIYIHIPYIYICICVFLMHTLVCPIRHVHLHGGGSIKNGFTIHNEGCHLGEGEPVPRGTCEYMCSLKSTDPMVRFFSLQGALALLSLWIKMQVVFRSEKLFLI